MKIQSERSACPVLSWIVGLLFIWAALGKLVNLQEFFAVLLGYQLPLPVALLRGTAIVLPWIELLCGLLLLAGRGRAGALAWTLALCAIFALCTGQAWLRGLDVSCGCLDLRLIGLRPGSAAAGFLESVRFAFFRSLALGGVSLYLFRRENLTEAAR